MRELRINEPLIGMQPNKPHSLKKVGIALFVVGTVSVIAFIALCGNHPNEIDNPLSAF